MTKPRVVSDVGRYTLVPKWVCEVLGSDDGALRLYLELGLRADDETRSRTASRKQLAGEMGCSLQTVDRRLQRLVEVNAIVVQSNSVGERRVASTYVLRLSKPIEQPALDLVEGTSAHGGTPTDGGTPNDGPIPTDGMRGTPTGGTTKNQVVEPQGSSGLANARPSERGAEIARRDRPNDPIFEVLYLAQTGRVYEPGARLTKSERDKINTAAGQVRAAEFTADDLVQAIEGWSRGMPPGSTITALGLVANLSRSMNAAGGVRFSRDYRDERRDDAADDVAVSEAAKRRLGVA